MKKQKGKHIVWGNSFGLEAYNDNSCLSSSTRLKNEYLKQLFGENKATISLTLVITDKLNHTN